MIELASVEKEYRPAGGLLPGRSVRALAGVTLQVEPGEVLGVIGMNGAGKSTLLKLMLGYLRPSGGSALVGGMPPRAYAEHHGVAYVPEHVAIPGRWTVRGALTAYAMLGNLGADAHERVDRAMARLGLESVADRKVRSLSKGTVQRLGIAQSIIADRALMILDEPTDGLDPVWVAELREIITEWRAADPQRMVIIASHNLAEVERIATRVVVLHEGRVHEVMETKAMQPGDLESRFLAFTRSKGQGKRGDR